MTVWPVAVAGVAGTLVALGVFLWQRWNAPQWAGDLRTSWGTVSMITLIVATLSGCWGAYTAIAAERAPLLALASSLSLSALGGCLVQSLYTDFQVRKGDRRVFTALVLATYAVNMLALWSFGDSLLMVMMTFLVVVFLAVLLLPVLNQGDTRAILLALTAGFPIMGFSMLIQSAYGVVALMILYALIVGGRRIVSENLRGSEALGVIMSNVSIPAIPLILLPFYLLALWSSLPN